LTVAKERNRLVWGALLVLFGLLWILETSGFIHGRLLGASIAATFLFCFAALCYLAFRAQPAQRWGFLVASSFFAASGVLAFGEIAGILPESIVPLIFFGFPAVAFGYLHAQDPSRTWALICGWLSAVIGVTSFIGSFRLLGEDLAGAVFLWACGITFLWHFLRTGKDWAILPGGSLLSAGFIPLLERVGVSENLQVSIFLLGLAMTFAALWALGTPGRAWARFPAVILGFLGTLMLVGVVARPLFRYVAPAALIGTGLYLILRSRENGEAGSNAAAPPPPPPAEGAVG
jgi:hypothetical protein